VARRYFSSFLLSLTAAGFLTTAGLANASTCTTTYDRWLKQYNTRCTDGTTATQTYDRWLKQDKLEIRQPDGDRQTCITTYDRWLKQARTTCR
jgi:hypothetical protein